MPAQILNGKAVSRTIKDELSVDVADFIQNNGFVPCLAAILVGDDPASEVYVRNKRQACEYVGLDSQLHRLDKDAPRDELLRLIATLNKSSDVHGILLQLPLPSHLDAQQILQAISPAKDVDALHPENVGRLSQGRPRFLPCTPHGVQQLLVRSDVPIEGQHVVVVGRSEIVGKPLAMMLAQRQENANATVTICHSRTKDLPAITCLADILVVAIGKPKFVTAEMVKPGATVIDVGVNRTPAGLVGDVDFDGVAAIAGKITPVPGGVGPLTIAMLLWNTLRAAREFANWWTLGASIGSTRRRCSGAPYLLLEVLGPLTQGLVQQHCGGHRHIEAIRSTVHG